jgi:hypothetical protein
MNWRLILFLSTLGPMTRILFVQEFADTWRFSGFDLVLIFLIIPIACAGWIAGRVKARYFLHGFITGFLFIPLVVVTGYVYDSYTGHPRIRDTTLKSEVLLILLSGVIFGLHYGFLASIAGKLSKREWRRAVFTVLLYIVTSAAFYAIGEFIDRRTRR